MTDSNTSMVRRFTPILLFTILAVFIVEAASAAVCVNKFVARREKAVEVVTTLLTGKLTFQEAQELAKAIDAKKAPPLEWVDDAGKSLGKQYGTLSIVRPMPVGCDGRTSGVVMVARFLSTKNPDKKMNVKLDANTTVVFEQQAE